ncbi:hypothetical protein ACJJTC_011009 [Scirpophaga incertulas]
MYVTFTDYFMTIFLITIFARLEIAAQITAAQSYDFCMDKIAYPVLNNCKQYLKCVNGTLFINICPRTDELSPIYNWCLPPKLAKYLHMHNQHSPEECLYIFPTTLPPSLTFNINSIASLSRTDTKLSSVIEQRTSPAKLDLSYNKSKDHKVTLATAATIEPWIKVRKVTPEPKDKVKMIAGKTKSLSSSSQIEILNNSQITPHKPRISIENSAIFSSIINPNLNTTDKGEVLNRQTTESNYNANKNNSPGHSTNKLITPTEYVDKKATHNYISEATEKFGILPTAKTKLSFKTSIANTFERFNVSEFDNNSTKLPTDTNFGHNYKFTTKSSLNTDINIISKTSVCNSTLKLCQHYNPCNISSNDCDILLRDSSYNQSAELITLMANSSLLLNSSNCEPSLRSYKIILSRHIYSSPPTKHFFNFSLLSYMTVNEKDVSAAFHIDTRLTTESSATPNIKSLTQETSGISYENQTKANTNKYQELRRNPIRVIKWIKKILRKLIVNGNNKLNSNS